MEVIKIVFLGLDSAGKTTILNILSKKYSFITNIAPTKTIERHETDMTVFGYSILNWDIPGQQKYRENLTFKDARTLQDSNVLVFVVDVQDLNRTQVATDYLQRVIKKIFEQGKELPYIAVFIHKMDPDIEENINILKNAKQIQDQINKISAMFNVDYYLTSMFVQPTVFIGFSSTVRKVLSRKKQKSLKSILEYFTNELLLNAIVILDKNSFIVNHFEKTSEDFKILQDFVYTLNSAYRNIKIHNLITDELKIVLQDNTFVFMPLLLNSNEIYIVGSSHDPDVSLVQTKANLITALQKTIK
ncbi:MAG: ADP-ribosylation factor-like protein [Promethearchaeota archaeon]